MSCLYTCDLCIITAMTTLGVKEYDEDPTNGESERITFDIFLRVA